MRISKHSYSSYAISFVLHGLIFLLLAIIWYHPADIPKWHEFEWVSEDLPKSTTLTDIEQHGTEDIQNPASSESGSPLSAHQNTAVKPMSSPLIETPVIGDDHASQATVDRIDHADLTGHLPKPSDSGLGNGTDFAYNASLVSGSSEAYIIRQNPPQITPLMDDEVLIEFKLSDSGRVLMNTVSVLSYKQSAHWEAIRKEMPSWRFGFKAKYNMNRVYRIRVIFRIN